MHSYGTEAGVVLEVLDGHGQVIRRLEHLENYGLVTTPNHSVVGWLQDDHTIAALQNQATTQVDLWAVPRGDHAAALVWARAGQDSPVGGGCCVYVNLDRDRGAFVASHGLVEKVPHLLSVSDVSQNFALVGRLTAGKGIGCWGMVRPSGRVGWRTCQYRSGAFSPDGRHVLGTLGRDYQPRTVAVLDLKGRLLARWSWTQLVGHHVEGLAWEDNRHLPLS